MKANSRKPTRTAALHETCASCGRKLHYVVEAESGTCTPCAFALRPPEPKAVLAAAGASR